MMNWRKIIFHQKSLWIALGLLSIVLSTCLPSDFIEQYYSRGVFLWIRKIMSGLTSWLPFAFVYLLFFAVLFLLIRWLYTFFKSPKPWSKKLFGLTTSLVALAGGAIFFFQLLWGFNYGRIPLEKQLALEVKPLTADDLRAELDWAINGMLTYRQRVADTLGSAIPTDEMPLNIEDTMRDRIVNTLSSLGYPTSSKVRGRLLSPQGILLRISTAGVYIPYTGEGHIDAGLHHLQLPFVLAHEMSHAYGIGGEGDCNFLAFLACINADDPYLKYVGYLYYFRYVAPDYRAYRPEEYKIIWSELPEGIKNDLRAIREQMAKFPDILPAVRDAAYNTYLKAQGIEDGIKNYDRVTMLAAAWRRKNVD